MNSLVHQVRHWGNCSMGQSEFLFWGALTRVLYFPTKGFTQPCFLLKPVFQ